MTAALDAINLLDDGIDPSPAALAALTAAENRAGVDHYRRELLLDQWAADRCVICGRTGEGAECDECTADWDAVVDRAGDV